MDAQQQKTGTMKIDDAEACERCGFPIPPSAPFGQCPKCLLGFGSGVWAGGASFVDTNAALGLQSFGDYELVELIARGGMGVVYRARQLSLGREVALKMVLGGELATEESVRRFRNEAAAAAKLEHPNIVAVYEVGECDLQHYFSMRLVPGGKNMADWARTLAGERRAERIAAMMAKVARAVAFAHERGVLHRDLKPSNILMDENGEPQITDFGLAKLLNEDSAITRSLAMLGSPSYMAPEQAEGRHGDITTATDVYGLGAVLYELLAGCAPFTGSTPLATARMVVEKSAPHLTMSPPDLRTVCMKCMAKEPKDRYVSAAALADDLERFARGEPVRAVPLPPVQVAWRWARRNPKVALLLGALAMAFLLGFAGVTQQWLRAERALDHLNWMETARKLESPGSPDAPLALARLAETLREDPSRWQAAMLAMSVIDQRACPLLAGPPVGPGRKFITPPRLAPDGTWFAAAGEDRVLRVWETATGKEKARMDLTAPAIALAVAEGPLVIAVATDDGAVSVCATMHGPLRKLSREDTQVIDELCFSADGSHLLGRSKECIEVWRGDATERPFVFKLEGGFSDATICADGSRVFAWNEKRAAVWETHTGRVMLEVTPTNGFRNGALAAGGRRVLLLDGYYLAKTWDIASGTLLSAVDSPLASWKHVVLNAEGTRFTAGGNTNHLVVHDTSSGLRVSGEMQHLYNVSAIVSSGDGRSVVTCAHDGRACLWEADTGRLLLGPIWLDTDSIGAVDLSRDGRHLLLMPRADRSGPAAVSVWQGSKMRPSQRHTVEGRREFNHTRLSPDGRLGCLGLSPGQRAYVYELATGRVLLDAVANGDVYNHLFSPDQRRYYALTANGCLHGWSLETGAPLWPPNRQPGAIRPGAISHDGTRIIAGHNDGHIRVYDTATGLLTHTLDHPGEVKTLRFAPDDSGRFISGSTDAVAHLWDLHTGKKLRSFTGHKQTIIASAWSPDGRHIATASYDQTARVWDVKTGEPIGQPMTHLAWLAHLEFSPDGRLLATACRDGTARLWHPLTGLPASAPLPQGDTALAVRFTRDGHCLLVRDHSGFRFWDTSKAEPVTTHYAAPLTVGIGMDSEAIHSILSTDATRVFLGYAMNAGELWTIPQPRTPVPAWFPDLLEGLALVRLERGTARVFSGEKLLALRAKLAASESADAYAAWARQILAEDAP